MDKIRAKEIASSSIMADVTYNEIPIYIESVSDKKETANIHPLRDPLNKLEVSLTSLKEH